MARQPNIVLINCDDLGYGDLGCYGSEVHDTPRIDALADEGVRLTSFYMAAPVCTPSRGSMLTGSYPSRIGFDDFGGLHVLFPGMRYGLNPEEHTIASVLKDAGYATEIIGKWHCGDQPEFLPTNHGFDRWFGLPYSNDMGTQVSDAMLEHAEALRAAGFTPPPVLPYPPLPLMDGEQVVEKQPDQTMLTRRYVERSVEFVRTTSTGHSFSTSLTCTSTCRCTWRTRSTAALATAPTAPPSTPSTGPPACCSTNSTPSVSPTTRSSSSPATTGRSPVRARAATPAPRHQGAHHGRRHAGPGHHPLAGCRAGRSRAR